MVIDNERKGLFFENLWYFYVKDRGKRFVRKLFVNVEIAKKRGDEEFRLKNSLKRLSKMETLLAARSLHYQFRRNNDAN